MTAKELLRELLKAAQDHLDQPVYVEVRDDLGTEYKEVVDVTVLIDGSIRIDT